MAPTENLTRAECDVRAALISDISYQVDLDLSGAPEPHPSSTFRSITRIDFGCREPGATTWVDLIADRVNACLLYTSKMVDGATCVM